MTKRRVMHLGEGYQIQEYDSGEWKTVGELPTLKQAKKLLEDLREIETI